MKKISFVLLVLAVSLVFAQTHKVTNKVKSKKGDIDLVSTAGGSEVVCAASFYEEMILIKKQDAHALVKGSCGQGWVNVVDVERVVVDFGDRDFGMDDIEVLGWMDCNAVFILDMDAYAFEGINISRHFGDFLKNTVDREQIEMHNQEN